MFFNSTAGSSNQNLELEEPDSLFCILHLQTEGSKPTRNDIRALLENTEGVKYQAKHHSGA